MAMFKMIIALVLSTGVGVLSVGSADAQERCFARYRFSWGQQVHGSIGATSGTACRVALSMRLGPIASAEIVQRPSSGTASIAGTYGVVYRSNPGFKGSDSMVVRYRGGRTGNAQATVNFAISVN
jgi:hypothetical protein